MRSALLPWAPYAKTTRLDEHGIALPKLSLKRPVRTRTRSFDLKCAPRTTSGLMSRIARPGIAAAGVRPVAGAVAERMTAEPASPISAERIVRLTVIDALSGVIGFERGGQTAFSSSQRVSKMKKKRPAMLAGRIALSSLTASDAPGRRPG